MHDSRLLAARRRLWWVAGTLVISLVAGTVLMIWVLPTLMARLPLPPLVPPVIIGGLAVELLSLLVLNWWVWHDYRRLRDGNHTQPNDQHSG